MKQAETTEQFPYNPWVFFLGGLVVVIILEQVGLLSPVRSAGQWFFKPLLRTEAQVIEMVSWPAAALQQRAQSYQDLVKLEKQYAQAAAAATQAAALEKENAELRKLLGEKERPSGEVQIVTSVSSYGRPTVVFDRGASVSEGNVVMYGRTVLGRVGVVSQNQATVELLSDQVLQPLLVKTEQGVLGLINGNGRQILLTEIPSNVELKVGEKIETAGQPGVSPHLFVGEVQSIQKIPDLPVQTAVVAQPVNFYQTDLVELRQ